MTETIKADIEQFISFFRDRLDEIGKIANVTYAHQYQKMLFLSAMDALARARWPKEPSNKKRFTDFVSEFSDWSEGQRISLPHLNELLKNTTISEFAELKEFARLKMNAWKAGNIYSLDDDPAFEDLIKLWPIAEDGKAERILGLALDSLTHIKLLYVCRNILVHEFRSPTADLTSTGPCYVNELVISYPGGPKREVWTLSYPVSFIKKLAADCLDKLGTYFRINQTNPYDSFVFGDYWLDELNRDFQG